MEKIKLAGCIALVSTAVTAGQDKPGFSGELTAFTAYSSEKSNFNTDNNKLESIYSAGESESEFLIAPLGQLRYTFGAKNEQKVFVGTSRDDIAVGDFVLELGYEFALDKRSSVAFSVLPTIIDGETWQDPFLTSQERSTTDVSGAAYRVKYNSVLQTPFSVDIAYYTLDVENERSGISILNAGEAQALQRSGTGIYSQLSYAVRVGETSVFEPVLTYQSFDADGSAMSNDAFAVDARYRSQMGAHSFSAAVSWGYTSFDSSHPVFDKTREDTEYGVFIAYEYQQIMGWKNWALSGLMGFDVNNSNINFYDKKEYIIGSGLTYRF
ncbi:DUF2860 domain-containing protein [Psychromonas ossibalaenae]|uniref:DUF2860 domain-containing protein n=1 Tax=Psychromonas ossibalaenae TaxID=444922 RepID=UPI000362F7E4|nr:DUF2860 domain-containing protein [Psychromonas ossibalaenae]